jgi:hypothetical protein
VKSLFGETIPDVAAKKTQGKYLSWKSQFHYRKTNGDDKCKYCEYSRHLDHHDKYYWKCSLMGISSSEASDIRAGNICDKFLRIIG